MLKFDTYGIYCPQADIYIDPWKPVDNALITHAHSDHSRFGNKKYLAHHFSVPVMKYRLGNDISVQGVEYGECITINGVKISFHPAGHIPGSSQIRLAFKDEVWVVSGDYKLQDDGISSLFEPVKCHHFVTESTFGLPIYHFPTVENINKEIHAWHQQNISEGKNSIIIGYALGKAQRILKNLEGIEAEIFVHGAVANINEILISCCLPLPHSRRITPNMNKKAFKNAVIVAPPSAIGTPWLKRFEPYSVGVCSGWMQLRGARRRQSVDRGFVMSDHADWNQLNMAVDLTGAENIYVTHGYKSIFARWLRDEMKLNAVEVDTLYEGENFEKEKADDIAETGGPEPDESVR